MTFRLESAEYAATHTCHDTSAVATHLGTYPYAVIFPVAGNYTYRLQGNTADVTSTFAAGIPIAIKPILIKATGAAAATVTVLYRK